MNNLDRQYKELLEHILHFGVTKSDRTGTGTKSIFGWQIRHKMSEGFPILTTKKVHFKSVVTELLWMLRGDTNIKYLVDNDCNIWVGDCYKAYQKEINRRLDNWVSISQNDMYEGTSLTDGNRFFTKEEFIDKIKTNESFAKQWGDLGPVYGAQWRRWNTNRHTVVGHNGHHNEFGIEVVDQIYNLILQLKNNPDSRRLMVNAWNVAEIDKMTLPPCHYGFQVWTRELTLKDRREMVRSKGLCSKYSFDIEEGLPVANKLTETEWYDKYNIPKRAISLMWNQRSVDTFLGLPFNIASYGLLLEIIAKEVNMVPEELIGNLGDTHLYLNHIEQAKEQLERVPYELPALSIAEEVKWEEGDCLTYYSINDFSLNNYKSHPAIKAPLSN